MSFSLFKKKCSPPPEKISFQKNEQNIRVSDPLHFDADPLPGIVDPVPDPDHDPDPDLKI